MVSPNRDIRTLILLVIERIDTMETWKKFPIGGLCLLTNVMCKEKSITYAEEAFIDLYFLQRRPTKVTFCWPYWWPAGDFVARKEFLLRLLQEIDNGNA